MAKCEYEMPAYTRRNEAIHRRWPHRAAVGALFLAALMAVLAWCRALAFAQVEAQSSAAGGVPGVARPDLATRVADLEAYVTNGAPRALSTSGPGHNAWMMVSSTLVL